MLLSRRLSTLACVFLALFSSSNTDCPPAGYVTRGASRTHHYKLIDSVESVSWARTRCKSDGGHMAFFKTEEELDSLIHYLNSHGSALWVGLVLPEEQQDQQGDTCSDLPSCSGVLQWQDGEKFENSDFLSARGVRVRADDGRFCMRARVDRETGETFAADDERENCRSPKRDTLCQVDCQVPGNVTLCEIESVPARSVASEAVGGAVAEGHQVRSARGYQVRSLEHTNCLKCVS